MSRLGRVVQRFLNGDRHDQVAKWSPGFERFVVLDGHTLTFIRVYMVDESLLRMGIELVGRTTKTKQTNRFKVRIRHRPVHIKITKNQNNLLLPLTGKVSWYLLFKKSGINKL